MTARGVAIGVAMLCVALIDATAWAVSRYEGEAAVPIRGDHVRDARNEAVKLAKRAALQAALDATWPASVLEAKRSAIRSKLIPAADRFILTSQTLFDARMENEWRVRLSVSFDMHRLTAAFDALASPYATGDSSILALMFDETDEGFTRLADFDRRVADALAATDVSVAGRDAADAVAKGGEIGAAVRGDLRPLAKIHETFGVRVVAIGIRRPTKPIPGEDAAKRRGDPDARTVIVRVHDLVAKTTLADFSYRWSATPDDAIPDSAASDIAARIRDAMVGAGLFETHAVRKLTVEVRGMAEPGAVRALTDAWKAVEGVRSVTFDSFHSGSVAVFVVEFSGKDESFADAVLKIEGAPVKLRPVPGRPGLQVFEVVR
ncbi:MAG: hypothetical protein IT350_04170 [Deltaproteobacteria bacterium]|nr:hypothetical protein [Deltaproteobacteria bacterium]